MQALLMLLLMNVGRENKTSNEANSFRVEMFNFFRFALKYSMKHDESS